MSELAAQLDVNVGADFDLMLFDEEFYLATYPDVAKAVRAGHFKTGSQHFRVVGKREGRKFRSLQFDPVFYLDFYPQVRQELEKGYAADPIEHYRLWGRSRGYLASGSALRPDNAAAFPSRFGGCWYDAANASDLINGKELIGLISSLQAEMLRHWLRHGWVVLPNAIPEDIVAAALSDLNAAYSGALKDQLFECGAVVGSRKPVPWQPAFNDVPAKALDIHIISKNIRDLIFAPNVTKFLQMLFESRCLASQSLGFWRGSAQEGHQDSAYVAYTMARNFAASWIALEDVSADAGELFYYDCSHRLDDFLFGGRFKTMHDCRRMSDGKVPPGEGERFLKSLQERCDALQLKKKRFIAKKGDVLIWHAELVHGGCPVSKDITRKSIVTHYCPEYVAPLYCEGSNIQSHRHGAQLFLSGVYKHANPAA